MMPCCSRPSRLAQKLLHNEIQNHSVEFSDKQKEDMNYEISAVTLRILNNGRSIAQNMNLPQVNTLCLLLSLLDETGIVTLLSKINLSINEIRDLVKTKIARQAVPLINNSEKEESNIKFDDACERVIKLSFLESKLTEGKFDDATLLLLAILHDQDNEAKNFLAQYNLDYMEARNILSGKQPTNGFAFDEEEPENSEDRPGQSPGNPVGQKRQAPGREGGSDTPMIDNFSTDLTALATKGALDPVLGREKEIDRMMQILCRRKKNNPILIGEPGVGKSAIVEGLAQRVVARKVPQILAKKRIVALDMASIVAGTQYRGQFEERLRRLLEELKSHSEIILFIDEIHTIIGAGSAAGSLDAANIMKPALARGEIQCIGATTISEFKKTIEKDGALDRRFQKVMLEPTTAEQTYHILQNIKSRYEEHHNVTYTDEALKCCVELTNRYITDRALPDKAIDALDEAGSRKHLSSMDAPKELEEKEQEIQALRQQKLDAAQAQNYELAANLRDQVAQLSAELERLTQAWQEQQKDHPAEVTGDDVADVVSMMSGVPASKVATNENARLRGMREALSKRVIAQDEAISKVAKAIIRNRIGLKSNDRPIGTFLFVGPTGVGKTHLVKCLAEWMFGSTRSLIRIDMSEYGEKYSVSRLLGAPPGYVGYEEGGQLTEQVRRHPYSVVLLDEIEKAHTDVFNTLLQVMDEGRLTDGNGTTVDFRNTIIILTSNSGTRQLKDFGTGIGFNRTEREIDGKTAESIVRKALSKQFAPEFLNRLDDIIMFNPLNKKDAHRIADIEIKLLTDRLGHNGLQLEVSQEARDFVVEHGFDAQFGARSLKRSIQHHIEDALCDYVMDHPADLSLLATIHDGKVVIEARPQDEAPKSPSTEQEAPSDSHGTEA